MCMRIDGIKKLTEGEIVYKCVRKIKGQYYSLTGIWSRVLQEGFGIGTEKLYEIGELHTSPAPGIYVFPHKDAAAMYSNYNTNRVLLKCYIPKGADIYYGEQNGEVAYGTEKLIVLEEV